MKQLKLLIIFFVISANINAQGTHFEVAAGINHSYVLNKKAYKKNPTSSPVFFWGGQTISNLTNNIDYIFEGKTGYFIQGSVIFPIKEKLAFETGFGVSMNNILIKKTSQLSGEVYNIINDTAHLTYDLDYLTERSFFNEDYTKIKHVDVSCQTFFFIIPLHIRLEVLKNKMCLKTGLTIFHTFNTDYKYSSSDPIVFTPSSSPTNYIEDNFINFHIGFKYNVYKSFYIGYHFEPNLNNTFNHSREDYSNTTIDLQLNSMAFDISYKF